MRTFIAGLVLALLGIAAAEYTRRHPSEPAKEAEKTEPKQAGAPSGSQPPPSAKELVASDSSAMPPNASADDVNELFASASIMKAADGSTSVMSGHYKARELRAGASFAIVIVEKDKKFALVRVSKEAPPKVLVARTEPIAAIAVDGDSVVWAEAGRVLSMPADGSGGVKTLANFPKASVQAVAAFKGVAVAALVPRDADIFSTDPNGAVVKIDNGSVTVLSPEQVRAHDLIMDGTEAFWISGYPAWLNRASLDGSFSAKIAERADGPLGFDGDFIVHRFPQTSGPEIRRMARAGGSLTTLARADVDWLAVHGGTVAYTTTGIGPRMYEVKSGGEPAERAAFKGSAKGLARNAAGTWLLVTDDDGVTSIQLY